MVRVYVNHCILEREETSTSWKPTFQREQQHQKVFHQGKTEKDRQRKQMKSKETRNETNSFTRS